MATHCEGQQCDIPYHGKIIYHSPPKIEAGNALQGSWVVQRQLTSVGLSSHCFLDYLGAGLVLTVHQTNDSVVLIVYPFIFVSASYCAVPQEAVK